MPRKKPTKKLGVYGEYDIPPEKAVDLYQESVMHNKDYIKAPYWDIAREGIELKVIKSERDYLEVHKIHSQMLEEVRINNKVNERRIAEMYDIQAQLRNRFIEVNDFIRDCEEKEKQADRKILAQSEIQNEMSAEIDKIHFDLEILSDFLIKLKETVKQFEPYEKVVEDVVRESPLLKNSKDLIARCDALMIAQVEISEMEQQKIKEIDEMRQKMSKATSDAVLTIMGLNNELAELERSYNIAKTESLRWEKILANTKDCIAENEIVTFRLLDQIQQLYAMLTRRNGEDCVLTRYQTEEMLDYMKYEIEVLQEVVKKSHIRMAREKKSNEASVSARKARLNKKGK